MHVRLTRYFILMMFGLFRTKYARIEFNIISHTSMYDVVKK
jgi:hypothetical protein